MVGDTHKLQWSAARPNTVLRLQAKMSVLGRHFSRPGCILAFREHGPAVHRVFVRDKVKGA